jgi:hypothetical protein
VAWAAFTKRKMKNGFDEVGFERFRGEGGHLYVRLNEDTYLKGHDLAATIAKKTTDYAHLKASVARCQQLVEAGDAPLSELSRKQMDDCGLDYFSELHPEINYGKLHPDQKVSYHRDTIVISRHDHNKREQFEAELAQHVKDLRKQQAADKRAAKKAAYLASPEGQAELQKKKEAQAEKELARAIKQARLARQKAKQEKAKAAKAQAQAERAQKKKDAQANARKAKEAASQNAKRVAQAKEELKSAIITAALASVNQSEAADEDDARCTECQVWYSMLVQAAQPFAEHLPEAELPSWSQCDHCEKHWCSPCKNATAMNIHEGICKDRSKAKAKGR